MFVLLISKIIPNCLPILKQNYVTHLTSETDKTENHRSNSAQRLPISRDESLQITLFDWKAYLSIY